MNEITKTAFLNALATTLYVAVVGAFLFYGQNLFQGPDTVFAPIAMLLLLILSAATTGFLVFGKPFLWYLDGRKKEALSLLFRTLVALFILTFITFLILVSRLG